MMGHNRLANVTFVRFPQKYSFSAMCNLNPIWVKIMQPKTLKCMTGNNS